MQKPSRTGLKRALALGGLMVGGAMAGLFMGNLAFGHQYTIEFCPDDLYSERGLDINDCPKPEVIEGFPTDTFTFPDKGGLWGSADPINDVMTSKHVYGEDERGFFPDGPVYLGDGFYMTDKEIQDYKESLLEQGYPVRETINLSDGLSISSAVLGGSLAGLAGIYLPKYLTKGPEQKE